MPGSGGDYRRRLEKFYAVHNPSCLSSIDAILKNYQGREEELLRILTLKYEAPMPAQSPSPQRGAPSASPQPDFPVERPLHSSLSEVDGAESSNGGGSRSKRWESGPAVTEMTPPPPAAMAHHNPPPPAASSMDKIRAALSAPVPPPAATPQTSSRPPPPPVEVLSPLSQQVASTLERLAAERSMEPAGPPVAFTRDMLNHTQGPRSSPPQHQQPSSLIGDPPARLAAAVSAARSKLLAFYSSYNPPAIPFVDGVLAASGIGMPPNNTPLPATSGPPGSVVYPSNPDGVLLRCEAIRAAGELLLTELTRTQIQKEKTARSISRSQGGSADAGLRSPSPPTDSRPRSNPAPTRAPTSETHNHAPNSVYSSQSAARERSNPYSQSSHQQAVHERDALILQLSTALEEKTAELEASSEELRNMSAKQSARGSSVPPPPQQRRQHDEELRRAREEVTKEKDAEMERLLGLLSDMERRYLEGVETTVPKLNRELDELHKQLSVEKEKRIELSREVAAKAEEAMEARKQEVLASTEAERLQSTVAVREHHVRLLRMQFDQLQQESDWKEEKIQRQGALLTEYGDKIHALMEENGALRLQVPRDFDDASGSPGAARRGFASLVRELQNEFEQHYAHRQKLAESEMNDYFTYAKKQIGNRDEIIEAISDKIEKNTQEVMKESSKRLADVYPEKERLLAEEVAKLQMQLSFQQEQHKALLLKLSIPDSRHRDHTNNNTSRGSHVSHHHNPPSLSTSSYPLRDAFIRSNDDLSSPATGGRRMTGDAADMTVLTPRHDSPEQQQQHTEPRNHHHHNGVAAPQDPSSSAISRTPSGVSAWKQVAGGEAVETSRSGNNNKRLNQFRAQRSNSRGEDGYSSRTAPNTQKGAPHSEAAYFYQRPSSMEPVPLHDAHPPPPSSSIYAGRRSPSAQHTTETRRSMSSGGGGGGYAAPKHVSMMYDRLASGSVGNQQHQH